MRTGRLVGSGEVDSQSATKLGSVEVSVVAMDGSFEESVLAGVLAVIIDGFPGDLHSSGYSSCNAR